MTSSFPRRFFIFLPIATVALYGCPQESSTPTNEYADVIFGGAATDEAMVALGSALEQQDPVEDPARSPVLDAPTETVLAKGTIVDFKWHFGASAAAPRPRSNHPSRQWALVPPTELSPTPEWVPQPKAANSHLALAPLLNLIGAPRAAHAHGDPLNGTATFLVFSTKTNSKLVRVFTDQTSFTPGQETWDALAAAGEEITLTLIAADFDANRIADGGDPVIGSPFKFVVE
ncbi:MAG: hypothetical protein IPK82_16360 [Polyangiaceae bacterium]|nr:hypothetical protein [Polyangiaceae bacterium]